MLAVPGSQPLGSDWVYEVKWDGMRVIADASEGELRLFSRNGRDVTVSFPELARVTDGVQDGLFDGEIIALDEGIPSFGALAERMHVADPKRAAALAERIPVTMMTFDLLRLYGVELMARPLTERRRSLDQLALPPRWSLSPTYDDGPSLFDATLAQGLEGVMAKRTWSLYHPGRRSKDWVKTPHHRAESVLVGGWRFDTGSASRIGSVLVGLPNGNGGVHYLGRVGSGIGGAHATALASALQSLTRKASPFDDELPREDVVGTTWCEPEVIVDVRSLGLTRGGRLRQPVFRGIRTDLEISDLESSDLDNA